MRIKLFRAASRDEAMALIREEMGEAAVILSEEQPDGGEGVEIRAAIRVVPPPPKTPKPAVEEGRVSPVTDVRGRLLEVMRYHAFPEGLGKNLVMAAMEEQAATHDPQAALAVGLRSSLACASIATGEESIPIFVGLPGGGKTLIVARQTRPRRGQGLRPEPISAGGPGNAARLGRLSGRIWARSARSPEALARLLSGPALGRGFVVDGPSINPRDRKGRNRLSRFLGVDRLRPVLALSAEGAPSEILDNARTFAGIGIGDVALTRIDLVRRLGPVIGAISAAGLSLGQLSWGFNVSTGLVSASPHRLARLLLATTPETRAAAPCLAKGAA